MDDHQPAIVTPTGGQADSSAKPAKSKGRGTAKTVQRQRAPTASQVTVTVPRQVLDAFDELSNQTGVNRQHLMREALSFYAHALGGGFRVFEMPGLRRVG